MKQKLIYRCVVIITFVVGVVGTIVVVDYFDKSVLQEKVVKTVNITETSSIKEAINKVYESVVVIETVINGQTEIGTGSGFVYKKDEKNGYIITNHHVISGSSSIQVTNSNGEEVQATLLGSDEYSDIAVISIPLESVVDVATIGTSEKVELGDTVFTVGSPLGSKYQGTVTRGIISGKDRQVEVSLSNGEFVMEVLQIDAAINPGNSGGPLVNINGEVIGVNSLKLVQDEIEGMGFSIPIELAVSSVNQLEKGETIIRPQLGIQMLDINDPYLLAKYKVTVSKEIEYGVVIVTVEDGSPADEAKLQSGDVIIEINGTKVKQAGHLKYMLYKSAVGDTIQIKYTRDNKEVNVEIKLTKALQ